MNTYSHEVQSVRENYVTKTRALKACAGLLITMAGITGCNADHDNASGNQVLPSASEPSPDFSTIEYNDPRNSDYSTVGAETTNNNPEKYDTASDSQQSHTTTERKQNPDEEDCTDLDAVLDSYNLLPDYGPDIYGEDLEESRAMLEGGTSLPEGLARSGSFVAYEYSARGLDYLPRVAYKAAEHMNGDEDLSCTQINQVLRTAEGVVQDRIDAQEGDEIFAGETFSITQFDKFSPSADEQVYIVSTKLDNSTPIR